jgi:RNA polymerase sigma factor (sigma-70 family)
MAKSCPVPIFPLTSVSAILGAASDDESLRERALESIARAYWKPVYKYLRLRWNLGREDAEDLTQEFFARAARESTFSRYDASIARFRTFVRACLDSMAKNGRIAGARLKRGGQVTLIDAFAEGEAELTGLAAPTDEEADDFFRREWLRSVFELAVSQTRDELRAAGKQTHWTIFERYDLTAHPSGARPTYGELGAALGVPPTQVTNFLALARRTFRRILLDRLREQCASNAEYRHEARELLGHAVL